MGQNMQKVQTLASMMLTGPVPFAPAGRAIISHLMPLQVMSCHTSNTRGAGWQFSIMSKWLRCAMPRLRNPKDNNTIFLTIHYFNNI